MVKSFLKKVERGFGDLERGSKKFFSKETGRKVDSTLRKVQNTLPEIADGVRKSGKIAGMIAPLAAGIPVYGAPIAGALTGYAAASGGVSKGLKEASGVGRGVRKELNLKGQKPSIEAPKPEPQEESEMFGNLFV